MYQGLATGLYVRAIFGGMVSILPSYMLLCAMFSCVGSYCPATGNSFRRSLLPESLQSVRCNFKICTFIAATHRLA